MLRIRFHGRGGHGVKTASRLVGTAAFRAGYQAQDCPVYGAERRGAAVAAYTRIDESPILERGVIARPDLIVIGDDSLLEAGGAVLAGAEYASAVFVNAPSAGNLAERFHISAPLVTLDVTARTLEALGKASALSAGLGAAAARLVGCIPAQSLIEAVQEELEHADLTPETIRRNVRLAQDVFRALGPVTVAPPESRRATRPSGNGAVFRIPVEGPVRAAPSILVAGNAVARPTGAWRVERPEIDYQRCTRCGLCFVRCPDGAIALDDEGYPVIDYDHCKGCMICWQQCPVAGAMVKKREVRAW
jgi:pyruvate ferredoxin oxidoreductase gamma subunit